MYLSVLSISLCIFGRSERVMMMIMIMITLVNRKEGSCEVDTYDERGLWWRRRRSWMRVRRNESEE